jgi:phosphohistidine phosphatase
MKRLWLLRHLKSSWDEPGLADHDRPLAPRGRKAGKDVRQWAADHDVRPDLVLCSTAVRTRATFDLVAPALGTPVVEFEGGIYHAWEADLVERLRGVAPDYEGVLMIGHNPGLHELAMLLAPPGPSAFPTGALAELRLGVDDWKDLQPGGAELVQLVIPRELAG